MIQIIQCLALIACLLGTTSCLSDLNAANESIELQELDYTPRLVYEHDLYYGGGIGGKSYDFSDGAWCPYAYIRNKVTTYTYDASGGGCSFVHWYSEDISDCRAIIHVGVPPFKQGRCVVQVYADQVFWVPFQAQSTSNATQNTTDTVVPLRGGMNITIGTCGLPGVTGTGDTFIRLTGPNGQTAAAVDDSCGGYLSNMTYTVPPGGDGLYTIKAGCWSDTACSGTLAYTAR